VRAAPLADEYRETPLWWDDTAALALPETPLPREVDVAVVGAGFTGLAAAAALARRGRQVAVLDAGTIGAGASGRNAGMIHAGLRRDAAWLRRHRGRGGQALHDASRDAYVFVARSAAQFGEAVQWSQSGWLHLAHRGSRIESLRRSAADRRHEGEAALLVEGDALRDETHCRGSTAGMVTDNGAAVHPARFLVGLAETALRSGAVVHEHTRVTGRARTKSGHVIQTSRGGLTAGEVLVATNGYTDSAFPALRRRVIPIGSYIIVTEPLTGDQLASVAPRRRMMSDTRNFLHYWRMGPGDQLLFGGRTSFAPVKLATARNRLYAAMVRLYPQLAGIRVSHSWTGNVGFTFDRLPHIGRMDGVTYALGYCGSGVAMGSWLGTVAGEWIAGAGAPAYAQLRFPTLPGYRGRPWFLPMVGWYYSLRDVLG